MAESANIHKTAQTRRTVVKTKRFRHLPHVLFQLELKPCGKPTCGKCPHGPYWYRYEWSKRTRRMVSSYVGKKLELTWE